MVKIIDNAVMMARSLPAGAIMLMNLFPTSRSRVGSLYCRCGRAGHRLIKVLVANVHRGDGELRGEGESTRLYPAPKIRWRSRRRGVIHTAGFVHIEGTPAEHQRHNSTHLIAQHTQEVGGEHIRRRTRLALRSGCHCLPASSPGPCLRPCPSCPSAA